MTEKLTALERLRKHLACVVPIDIIEELEAEAAKYKPYPQVWIVVDTYHKTIEQVFGSQKRAENYIKSDSKGRYAIQCCHVEPA
jgi:hypothetical protein